MSRLQTALWYSVVGDWLEMGRRRCANLPLRRRAGTQYHHGGKSNIGIGQVCSVGQPHVSYNCTVPNSSLSACLPVCKRCPSCGRCTTPTNSWANFPLAFVEMELSPLQSSIPRQRTEALQRPQSPTSATSPTRLMPLFYSCVPQQLVSRAIRSSNTGAGMGGWTPALMKPTSTTLCVPGTPGGRCSV